MTKQHIFLDQRKCKYRNCSNQFRISRSNQYYCSQSCRQKEYLSRNGFSVRTTTTHNKTTTEPEINIHSTKIKHEIISGLLSGIIARKNVSMTNLIDGLRDYVQKKDNNR
jgi:hypothetical protein